jgi:cephalosporin hydroxylase
VSGDLQGLPQAVDVDLHARDLRDYWRKRAVQHTADTYAGVPMSKFPEDLRVYEHLLWLARPTVVIELGVQYGGGTLWWRDRLAALEHYTGRRGQVIGVELDAAAARASIDRVDPSWAQITLLEGDVCDPALPDRVAEHVPAGARCLVIEDTAHVYDTTRAALDGFARFVGPGGFLVVEDGCVDDEELRLPDWPRGVLPAVADWLLSPGGAEFTVHRELQLYGVTCHPSGFLRRAGEPEPLPPVRPGVGGRLRGALRR